jgi:rhodanese-related sulfurtransferase
MAETATLTAGDLQTRLGNDPKIRLLDVRSPGEFAAARIPGSHNIPLGDLSAHASRLVDGSVTELVLVCQSGGRAGLAADVLGDAGHDSYTVLTGGLNAWEQSGGEVEGGTGNSWSIERQVRLVAGAIVATGIVASTKYPKAKFLSGAVGGGLVFAAVSNTCMMGSLLAKLPFNRAGSGDVESAIASLTS